MCNRPFSEFEYRTGLVATSNAAGAMNRPSWHDLLWTNGGADLFTCCHRRGGWGEYREAKTNCRSYLAVLSDELAFARRVFFTASLYFIERVKVRGCTSWKSNVSCWSTVAFSIDLL